MVVLSARGLCRSHSARQVGSVLLAVAWALLIFSGVPAAAADFGEMGSLEEEQAREKVELGDMKKEMADIKKTMSEAAKAAGQVGAQLSAGQIKEFHLVAKEAQLDIGGGITVPALTYNGQSPGPVIRVQEGDAVRIVLHNQLRVPTSLYFQGLILPHRVVSSCE